MRFHVACTGVITRSGLPGNFYTVGIYSNGDEHDEEMQVENALIYASKLVQIGASVPSPLRLRLAVAVHASDGFSHYNVSSGSEAFSTGTALQEAVETLGYPDCVCVGQEVHALAAGAPTPWQFVPLPVVEAERELWLLEAGDWVRAQVTLH